MTDAITIALSKLRPWDGNVRKTGAAQGIEELAASIATHGLLQSLVVRKARAGKYEVIAGRRRYLALQSLAENKVIAKDFPVPCMIANAEMHAAELSLVENTIRAPMHPADQFEAFRDIIEAGASIGDVAARFGIQEGLVVRRLKLGRLSPVILDAYRNGDLGLEEAEAFTLTDDRDTQERIFSDLSGWQRSASAIRRALTQGEIPATDKRVRFVGLDAYEAAGGSVRRDLFDEETGGYVLDPVLLDQLVADKLASTRAQIADEGWAWVEIVPEIGYSLLSSFTREASQRVLANDADQAEYERLSTEYDAIVDSDDADSDRLDEIEEHLAEMPATESWPAEVLAVAGALIALDYDGEIHVERGLIRKADEKGVRRSQKSSAQPGSLPATLLADLTAQKSAAIGAELLENHDVALAAVVHALVLKVVYLSSETASCLGLSVSIPDLNRTIAVPERSAALARLESERVQLLTILPEDSAQLWDWCLTQPRDVLLRVLAFAAAVSVDVVQRKHDMPVSDRLAHGGALADALALNMRTWFVPGAENYFGRISRVGILTAIDEAKGTHAPALDKLSKAELATRAQDLLVETEWLPVPLRTGSANA